MSFESDTIDSSSIRSGIWHCPETGEYCMSIRSRNMAARRHRQPRRWVPVIGGSGEGVLVAKLAYEEELRLKHQEKLDYEQAEREAALYQEKLMRDQDHEI